MTTRRQLLLRSAAAGAATVLAPQEAWAAKHRRRRPTRGLLRGGHFRQGVLSGDPSPDGPTLLTVLDGSGSGKVRLEVARDSGFRHVVATKDILTTPELGHSVKARVGGLEPHRRYWYRFETRDRHSPVGRFQTTLPPDSHETVRFAFFSCADYTHGYYNAYELLAHEDLDFVVCLGDYVYAESYFSRTTGGVRDDPIGEPNPYNAAFLREAGTLHEYRAKYALYRRDASLRRMHATFPMVAVWDDHELQNNYAGAARDGGVRLRDYYSRARRGAAYRAFFESMPVFPRGASRIYRSARHGRTVELVMLDERQYRDNQPCGDAIASACPTWNRPRSLLGRRQLEFLKQRLAASKAAWKVVGGQSMAMPLEVGDDDYYHFDAWQGYPQEREELLQHLAATGTKDVVFITGDIHTFFAGDVRTAMGTGTPVGVEFAGGSISSPTFGETRLAVPGGHVLAGNDAAPSMTAGAGPGLLAMNPWIDQVDLDHHGYGIVAASRSSFEVMLKRLYTIKQRNLGTLPATGFTWKLARGQTSIKGTAV
jgi:alkaline phosphatase D